MMGSRGSKGGGEYDAFSRISRRAIIWKPGEAKGLKRAFHHRQRIQPISLDMYDQQSGGWLHPFESEEPYFYLAFVPGQVEDKWDYFYD